MNQLNPQQLIEALNWRYATKVFDATKKIPNDIWQTLKQALVLTPTSYGLQPYKFLVIDSPAKRAKLLQHSWGQKQVVDASHFIVFAAQTNVTEAHVDKLINRTSQARHIPSDSLSSSRRIMLRDLVTGPRSRIAHEWATRQSYIALGNLMTCAAVLGVDACPMEGFVPGEFDRILGLNDSGYASVVCCALGYRSAHDKSANLAKVRYEIADLVNVV
jgi:nitroreductase